MRAIIIEEESFTEIRNLIRLEAELKADRDPENKLVIMDTHRLINYLLVKWMQRHGVRQV